MKSILPPNLGHYEENYRTISFIDIKIINKTSAGKITKIILKKNQVGKLKLPDFKPYCKSTVIKISWHWRKDGYINHGTEERAQK